VVPCWGEDVRAIAAVLASVFVSVTLSACAGSGARTGTWHYDRESGRIGGVNRLGEGAEGTKVFVRSRRASPPPGEFFADPAGLQLTCFRQAPAVQIRFAFPVGSNTSATLAYRFDDRPARHPAVRFLSNRRDIVITDPDAVALFVAELRTATLLFVEVDSLTVGRATAEFAVGGAEAAIGAAYADCPLPARA
jgi:hypothetical protein